MYEVNVSLSPKDILNKDFKVDAKGYRPQEVDQYLDTVIQDYTEFIRYIKKLERDNRDLVEDNNRLKNEIRKIRMEFETVSEENETGKYTSTNVDLLKRLSNLEKIVYGKNE